jgi:hypothetical protein
MKSHREFYRRWDEMLPWLVGLAAVMGVCAGGLIGLVLGLAARH